VRQEDAAGTAATTASGPSEIVFGTELAVWTRRKERLCGNT
jgi:hypothetical protein